MEYVLVAITVLLGAGLTYFSGFGLGTLMLPVFSLFFPLPVAIGATAIVHVSNNLFKFGLVYKYIHFPTLVRFGIPALVFAAIGSYLLGFISHSGSIYTYRIGTKQLEMTYLKMVIGTLMVFFAWVDLSQKFSGFQVPKRFMAIGGALSGFFGGISGHQGAFRSAFLTKAGLTKEQFIGTSNAIALVIDFARIGIYAKTLDFVALADEKYLLLVGIVFAFIGTYFGKELVQKTTLKGIQKTVGLLLFLLGGLFILGLV
jgi:uncharacterized membrane protein YfcA